jgi:hypothetical protein
VALQKFGSSERGCDSYYRAFAQKCDRRSENNRGTAESGFVINVVGVSVFCFAVSAVR